MDKGVSWADLEQVMVTCVVKHLSHDDTLTDKVLRRAKSKSCIDVYSLDTTLRLLYRVEIRTRFALHMSKS